MMRHWERYLSIEHIWRHIQLIRVNVHSLKHYIFNSFIINTIYCHFIDCNPTNPIYITQNHQTIIVCHCNVHLIDHYIIPMWSNLSSQVAIENPSFSLFGSSWKFSVMISWLLKQTHNSDTIDITSALSNIVLLLTSHCKTTIRGWMVYNERLICIVKFQSSSYGGESVV